MGSGIWSQGPWFQSYHLITTEPQCPPPCKRGHNSTHLTGLS